MCVVAAISSTPEGLVPLTTSSHLANRHSVRFSSLFTQVEYPLVEQLAWYPLA